jgi:hypothetical protein
VAAFWREWPSIRSIPLAGGAGALVRHRPPGCQRGRVRHDFVKEKSAAQLTHSRRCLGTIDDGFELAPSRWWPLARLWSSSSRQRPC